MECLTARDRISNTVNQVRENSFEEKKHFPDEKTINRFLDNILELKRILKSKTDRLNDLNQNLQQLTWIDDKLDDECLKMINDLIANAKDLHSSLIRYYVSMNPLNQKGIAKEEIKKYKLAIDDLKEIFTDLDSVFFYLPEIPGFKETTREISLL